VQFKRSPARDGAWREAADEARLRGVRREEGHGVEER